MTSMGIKVGVPQALSYYDYHFFWDAFLHEIGIEVVNSGPTTKRMVDLGVSSAIDEACLPVKVFYGHVRTLMEQPDLDALFLPRLVSVERRSFICPKFMGIPDMIRVNLSPKVRVVDTCVDMSRGAGALRRAAVEAGRELAGASARESLAALGQACAVWRTRAAAAATLRSQCRPGWGGQASRRDPDGTLDLLVLGHAYNLSDPQTSLGLDQHLKELGGRAWGVESFPPEALNEAISELPRHLFWTSGRHILAAARHVVRHRCVDGIVHLVSFGCGPDSLVGEMVQRETSRSGGMPFLLLTVDEHTGEAGLLTRLEAFIDMIRRRRTAAAPQGGELD